MSFQSKKCEWNITIQYLLRFLDFSRPEKKSQVKGEFVKLWEKRSRKDEKSINELSSYERQVMEDGSVCRIL